MKWKIAAGLLTLLMVQPAAAPTADACGLKLTVKSQSPRKAVARTSNPSDVLLLGNPPRRLELDLSAAGHRVDVAPNAAAAKKKSYAVVITDADQQADARSTFSGSTVIVRSGDVAADIRTVESQVGRKPLRVAEGRTVVAARPVRTPIASGGGELSPRPVAVKEREPVDSGGSEPTPTPTPRPVEKAPTPKPVEKVTTQPRPPAPEVKPPEVTPPAPTPEPRPKVAVKAAPAEVYFSVASFRLAGSATAALNRTARWLKASPDVQVVVEGHADPSGTPEGNLALAQRRAELVRDFLVSAGIDASRIEVISYGDTRLKYGRTDYRNRRVAVVAK